jgi:hypothetical protein
VNEDELVKHFIGSGGGLILRYYPGIRLGGIEENHKKPQSG